MHFFPALIGERYYRVVVLTMHFSWTFFTRFTQKQEALMGRDTLVVRVIDFYLKGSGFNP